VKLHASEVSMYIFRHREQISGFPSLRMNTKEKDKRILWYIAILYSIPGCYENLSTSTKSFLKIQIVNLTVCKLFKYEKEKKLLKYWRYSTLTWQ
jgi:hypothetical protein